MKIKKFKNLSGHAKRSGKVTHILPHHMAGNLSLEKCHEVLENAGSSATYAIDSNGNIGQFLDEGLEPYTSSNREIDDKAITIEVANDGGAPNWHVSDKALKSLIELLVDVCKRHGIAKLDYTGDKKGNLQKHSYYAPTACPGPYLGGKFKYIQDEVNKQLNSKPLSKPTAPKPTVQKKSNSQIADEVIAGKWGNGTDRKSKLEKAGYNYKDIQNEVNKKLVAKKPISKKSNTEIAKEVIAGKWGNGDDRKNKLKKAGYNYNDIQKIVNKIL